MSRDFHIGVTTENIKCGRFVNEVDELSREKVGERLIPDCSFRKICKFNIKFMIYIKTLENRKINRVIYLAQLQC